MSRARETKDTRKPIDSRLTKVPLIGDLLVQKKFISNEQQKCVLYAIAAKKEKGETPGFFGEEALLLKRPDGTPLITREQLNIALMTQAKLKIKAVIEDYLKISDGCLKLATLNTNSTEFIELQKRPHWGNAGGKNPVNPPSQLVVRINTISRMNNDNRLSQQYNELKEQVEKAHANKHTLGKPILIPEGDIQPAKIEALSALANIGELIVLYANKHPESLKDIDKTSKNKISAISLGIMAIRNISTILTGEKTSEYSETSDISSEKAIEYIQKALGSAVAQDLKADDNPQGTIPAETVTTYLENRCTEIQAGLEAVKQESLSINHNRANSR